MKNVVEMGSWSPATSMAADLAQDVRKQFADHLRDAAQNGGAYIDEMADHMVRPKSNTSPRTAGMHPLLGQLVRELMRDTDVSRRRASS